LTVLTVLTILAVSGKIRQFLYLNGSVLARSSSEPRNSSFQIKHFLCPRTKSLKQ